MAWGGGGLWKLNGSFTSFYDQNIHHMLGSCLALCVSVEMMCQSTVPSCTQGPFYNNAPVHLQLSQGRYWGNL